MQAHMGGRQLSRAALRTRELNVAQDVTVSRKELSAAARDAEQALNLRPALRQVLHELVGVWGERELKGRLLVWPSNAYICQRTGLSERMVRYGLKGLIELGLVTPKDSANGKRFGIRGANGQIVDAYGFDLTPLQVRRGEFEIAIAEQKRLRSSVARKFDLLTILRRGVSEALTALRSSFSEQFLEELDERRVALQKQTPRRSASWQDEAALDGLIKLWTDLQVQAETAFMNAGNGGTDCRHIETDNGPSRKVCSRAYEQDVERTGIAMSAGLVTDACPAIAEFYTGRITGPQTLVSAAEYLRPALGASPSAWTEAKGLLGDVGAASVLMWVLQLHADDQSAGTNRIVNPGGYFRAMARKVADHHIHLELELMAMRRRRLGLKS